MSGSPPSGFTLIELMIGLAIAAILLVLAMPGYSTWIADSQIRNAAESIASGLRYAQAEAIRQNSTVQFTLDPTSGTGGWTADLVDITTCKTVGASVQVGTFKEGANRVGFTTLDINGVAGGTVVTFTSLGDRMKNGAGAIKNCDGTEMLGEVDIASGVAGSRQLNVVIFGGKSGVAGQGNRSGIKICDPKWPATDPKGCPA